MSAEARDETAGVGGSSAADLTPHRSIPWLDIRSLGSGGILRADDISRTNRRILVIARIAAGCFLLGFALIAYWVILIPTLQRQSIADARRLASVLSCHVVDPVASGSRERIESALSGAFKLDNVALVQIVGPDGSVLAHLGSREEPPQLQKAEWGSHELRQGRRIWVMSPILDPSRGMLGSLVLGYSMESQLQRSSAGLLILLFIAAVGTLGSSMLVRWMVRKQMILMRDIALAVRSIALERDPSVMPANSADETDQILSSFNEAVSRLAASRRKLEGQAHELERAVAERTSELRRKNLALALQNEKIMEISRMKTDFMANISHELRTPLNGILALSELLRDEIAGPLANSEQKKQAAMIHQSGQTLLRLINDILDLSRIEAGRIEISYEKVDIREILLQAVEEVRPLAQRKSLDLHVSMDAGPELWIDPARVRQVSVNLVGNAVKFTDKGRVSVTARIDPADERLALTVEDTGIGIAPQDHDRVFQEFRQVDGSATRRFGGTGLGLSISRRLARLMGGDIELVSDLGQGSRFTFWAPAFREQPGLHQFDPVRKRITLLEQAFADTAGAKEGGEEEIGRFAA